MLRFVGVLLLVCCLVACEKKDGNLKTITGEQVEIKYAGKIQEGDWITVNGKRFVHVEKFTGEPNELPATSFTMLEAGEKKYVEELSDVHMGLKVYKILEQSDCCQFCTFPSNAKLLINGVIQIHCEDGVEIEVDKSYAAEFSVIE